MYLDSCCICNQEVHTAFVALFIELESMCLVIPSHVVWDLHSFLCFFFTWPEEKLYHSVLLEPCFFFFFLSLSLVAFFFVLGIPISFKTKHTEWFLNRMHKGFVLGYSIGRNRVCKIILVYFGRQWTISSQTARIFLRPGILIYNTLVAGDTSRNLQSWLLLFGCIEVMVILRCHDWTLPWFCY